MPDVPLPLLVVVTTGLISLFGGSLLRGRRAWATFAVVGLAVAMVALALESDVAPLRRFLDWLLLGTAFGSAASLAGLPSHRRDLFAAHPEGGLVPGLLVVATGGAMLIGHAPDAVGWVVGLELAIVPLAVLLLRTSGDTPSRATAVRFAATEVVGFVAVVAGTAATFAVGVRPGSVVGEIGTVLLLAGLAIRARLAPFHAGHDEVAAGSSAWTAGVIATLPRLAVGAFLLRALPHLSEVASGTTQTVAIVVGVASVLFGGIATAFRSNVRGVLSAATIGLFGLVLLAASVAAWEADHPGQGFAGRHTFPGGRGTILLLLAMFAVFTTGVYAVLVHVTRPERTVDFVDDLTGLGRTEPAAAAALVVLLVTAVGLPPLAGFWGRLSTVVSLGSAWSALGVGDGPMVTAASPAGRLMLAGAGLVAALGGVLLAMGFARWLVVALFEPPRTTVRPSGGEPALAVAVLCAVIAVGLGLIPGPLFGWIRTITGS